MEIDAAVPLNAILKKLSQRDKPTKASVGGMLEKFGVFELTQPSTTSAPIFCVKKKDTPTQFSNEAHDNSFNYKPVDRVPWALPTEPQSYESYEKLWQEVKDCIYQHVDLPDVDGYDALTAWVFASWMLEKWTIAPYLFFFGTFGTGKTRALEVLSKMSSRGWLALNVSTASLYRPTETWHPTLFLDESECYGSKFEIISLLNGSYRKGQYVARQREIDGDYTTDFFDCFTFKAIAGTKELIKTLQSRCIIFRTSHATRKIRFFVDDHRCLSLRNQLLKMRFDRLLSEDSEQFEDISKQCEALVDVIGNQREVELFYPLIAVAPNDEIKNRLIEYAKKSANSKMEELSLTTESLCLSAIVTAKSRGYLKNGKMLISDITSVANENLSFDEQWKERMTASLCSRLGFQKTRGTQGKTCIIWSEPLLERLKKDRRYAACFVPIEESSICSKSSLDARTATVAQIMNPNWMKDAKEVQTA